MQAHLISYLRDNRDQIIENWLTEAELPAASHHEVGCESSGVAPYEYLGQAFDTVLKIIDTGRVPTTNPDEMHLNDFLGATCTCKARCFGGRVCMELHDSGLKAFMSVFDEDWDADHEFTVIEVAKCEELINHALSGFIGQQVEECNLKQFRTDCPFAAMQTQQTPPKQ